MTCLRVEQNVNTRFNARCVFSRATKEGGHGIEVVTGFEDVDEARERVGGAFFGLVTRLSFLPPSWVLVGRVEILEVADASSG